MKNTTYKYYELSASPVLNGYTLGIFPMGEDDGSISWYETSPRAILPIELQSSNIHLTRSLSQVIKKNVFEITADKDFEYVIHACAHRNSTWINKLILNAYMELFKKGYAHSIETRQGGKIVGGLYGVAYKGAFFGESMFHTVSNASKAAVVRLYEILKKNEYLLLDIQMMTPHFETFGAIEISKRAYLEILERAMGAERRFEK